MSYPGMHTDWVGLAEWCCHYSMELFVASVVVGIAILDVMIWLAATSYGAHIITANLLVCAVNVLLVLAANIYGILWMIFHRSS